MKPTMKAVFGNAPEQIEALITSMNQRTQSIADVTVSGESNITTVTGRPQDVMFVIGEVANSGEDSLLFACLDRMAQPMGSNNPPYAKDASSKPGKGVRALGSMMRIAFPEFPPLEPELLALLEAFGLIDDSSYRNDVCASVMTADGRWQLFIDHPEPSEREFQDKPRFTMTQNDEDGEPIDQPPTFLCESLCNLAEQLCQWQSNRH